MNLLMILLSVAQSIIDLPKKFKYWLSRKRKARTVFSNSTTRSDSESTPYTDYVEKVSLKPWLVNSFRRDFYYRSILEHVTYSLGKRYYALLSADSKELLSKNLSIRELSKVGSPRRYYYKQIRFISPTILRYALVVQEMEKFFGKSLGSRIVEIGVGFGGQFALLQQSFEFEEYYFYDLTAVQKLAIQFLEKASQSSTKVVMGDASDPSPLMADFVISNYAFSELPYPLQLQYMNNIISKSKNGFMMMNSGRTNLTGRSVGKMSLSEICRFIPNAQVIEEFPKTGPDNYLIVWKAV
jgi:putative sugar O-methyltransferase